MILLRYNRQELIHFVTNRGSSWACIGNPKQQQESSEGTHARETPAHRGLQAVRCRQGLKSPMRTDVEVVVGHIVARVGCSRSDVGPCIACSLRSRVAPALETP